MKRLHREMVLSDLYCRSSSNAGADPSTSAADPDNACYWRMNPRRMEAQVVRDSLLQIAGNSISRSAVRVSTLHHRRPARAARSTSSKTPMSSTASSPPLTTQTSSLECYRRNESIVPQQAWR